MVIETFKDEAYLSRTDTKFQKYFQLMETNDFELFDEWIAR
jgi:succinate dehydrogenase flavin-adding protein (antitoxin of CptAB toxin-antitoxin module)